MNLKQILLTLFFTFGGVYLSFSQENQISKSTLESIITEIAQKLRSDYVFPEVAEKMADQITQNLKNGAYD